MYVCDEAEVTCNQCGIAGATGPGQWVAVSCSQPIVGSIVKVVTPTTHLQLCEVEIYGVAAATGIYYHDSFSHKSVIMLCISTLVIFIQSFFEVH